MQTQSYDLDAEGKNNYIQYIIFLMRTYTIIRQQQLNFLASKRALYALVSNLPKPGRDSLKDDVELFHEQKLQHYEELDSIFEKVQDWTWENLLKEKFGAKPLNPVERKIKSKTEPA